LIENDRVQQIFFRSLRRVLDGNNGDVIFIIPPFSPSL